MPRRADPKLPPPRPEALAFLRAIKETPEDDAPRLVFADWLEEQGDPRGEFLRLQCALARLGEADPARAPLDGREWELRECHEAEWLGPLYDLAEGWEFRRGLVQIELTARRFSGAAFGRSTATEAYAWVDGLCLSRVTPGALAKLLASPYLGGISALGLQGGLQRAAKGIGAAGAAALAASPHLARLSSLHLKFTAIGAAGAQALAASAHLARLTALDLTGNAIGAAGAEALASSGHLARLTALDLGGNAIGAAGAAALAASPHLAGLTSLDLGDNPIGAAGARALRRRFGDRVAL
jgi:uncharacterized protein (TIGR02996 family)